MPEHTIENTAELLYTTYCNEVGGRAFNGDPLPDWETFARDPAKAKQANAWRAAADAVARNFGFTLD